MWCLSRGRTKEHPPRKWSTVSPPFFDLKDRGGLRCSATHRRGVPQEGGFSVYPPPHLFPTSPGEPRVGSSTRSPRFGDLEGRFKK